MDLFTKKAQKKIYISKLDCEAIVSLMNNGFTFIDSCNLIESNQNKNMFKTIKTKLEIGEEISEVFLKFCPLEYKSYFISFIKFLPFKNSLSLAISIYNESNNQRKIYLKKMVYPVLMLICTIIGIYVFILIAFPVLISLMKEFNNDLNHIIKIQKISYILLNILFVFISLILLLILFYIQKNNKVKGYKLISKFKISRIIKLLVCNDFARFYEQCLSIGCSTLESINILKSLNEKPVIVFLANKIDKALLKGETMEKAFKSIYFDKGLYRFLNISMYVSNMDEMIKGYIKVNEIKINKFYNIFLYSIQIITYVSISLILVFVYQILMMPLNIISNL